MDILILYTCDYEINFLLKILLFPKIRISKLHLYDYNLLTDTKKIEVKKKYKKILFLYGNFLDSYITSKIAKVTSGIKINIDVNDLAEKYKEYKNNLIFEFTKINLQKELINYQNSTITELYKSIINNFSNLLGIKINSEINNTEITKEYIKNLFFYDHCEKINNHLQLKEYLEEKNIDYLLRCGEYNFLQT